MNRKLKPSDSIALISEFVLYTYLKTSALWTHSGQHHFHCFQDFIMTVGICIVDLRIIH